MKNNNDRWTINLQCIPAIDLFIVVFAGTSTNDGKLMIVFHVLYHLKQPLVLDVLVTITW